MGRCQHTKVAVLVAGPQDAQHLHAGLGGLVGELDRVQRRRELEELLPEADPIPPRHEGRVQVHDACDRVLRQAQPLLPQLRDGAWDEHDEQDDADDGEATDATCSPGVRKDLVPDLAEGDITSAHPETVTRREGACNLSTSLAANALSKKWLQILRQCAHMHNMQKRRCTSKSGCTRAYIYTCTDTSAFIQLCASVLLHQCVPPSANRSIHLQLQTRAFTYAYTYKAPRHLPILLHLHNPILECLCKYTCLCMYNCAYTHIYVYDNSRMNECTSINGHENTEIHTHEHIQIQTQSAMRTHMHVHICKCKHTNIHIHSCMHHRKHIPTRIKLAAAAPMPIYECGI